MSPRAVTPATSDRIKKRDGEICAQCGSREDLTIDHIHPRALGGDHEDDNLRVLCRSCNSRKGARIMSRTSYGLRPGFFVALTLKEGANSMRCHVGEVQTVDDYGVRITYVDWVIGRCSGWDFFAPWDSIASAQVATSDHSDALQHFGLDEFGRVQSRENGKTDS